MTDGRLGWKRVTARVLLTMLVFGLVGPLIGVLVFWTVGLPLMVKDADLMAIGPLLVIAYFWIVIPLTYFFGFIPAVVTGAVVCGMSALRPPATALYAAAALAGAVTSAPVFWTGGFEEDPSFMAAAAISGLLAALPCARITRRWRLGPPETSQGAGPAAAG